ncbi:class I SAM-dependent methyltransferase [Chitinophaga horti]|uniref:Class I SAM-dependent methyltransferase n=1 Tax=Chitinophaga horti TaxID=2920382 RepID=A0ABY6J0W2_9BACT|nr:class I SAM-dependent methyltransferase [Chitinophaga horti]UYQ93270.1 class I SAM-dependent methyltransferase [Chitinophaga horti]
MELLDQKVQVAPTAALVLLQAREIFVDGIGRDYLSHLDLSAIEPMLEKLNDVPGAMSRVVQFRKQYLRFLADAYLPESEPVQVVILGAGLDPLGLQLLERYSDDIAQIFEVDTAHLAEKEIIYRKLAPNATQLHLIHCDITDPHHLLDCLVTAGYDKDVPTIVVFEGVVHYITQEKFYDIMRRFRTRNRTNLVLMDYSLPYEDVSPGLAPAYRKSIQSLEYTFKCRFYQHSRLQVFGLIDRLGGDVSTIDSLQDVEFKIKGRNEHYYDAADGVLEIISFYL